MIKNKLIWNIALLLIAVISLPLAYAQTSLGGSLYFVIVNAAIIGIILFALQAYLIPGKPEKERTVVWIVVLVASLLIAWLVGREGYIWQGPLRGFFSIYVLVNAILIGAFLYFLLGFLKIGQFASKEGTTGYGILLFLVAMVFAVKLGNQWIWEQGTIRLFGSYLFGSEGILNPSGPKYRLWTFIGSAVLLSFFFQNYLVTGGEKKVNYALALIIAANLASGGIAIRSVVIMAEIVFLITMAKTLGDTTTKRYGTNWFIAAFLIGWGSAAATYGTEYEGGLARIVGWFLGWFGLVGAGEVARPTSIGWWGKVGLVTFIIVGTITFFVFVIGRGEMRNNILREGVVRLGQVIKNKLRQNRIGAALLNYFNVRDITLPGELPFAFKDLRLEIYTLMNYLLRYDIYSAKLKFLEEMIKKIQGEKGKEGTEGILRDRVPIREDVGGQIKRYVEGSKIKKDETKQTWELVPIWNEEEGKDISTAGIGHMNFIIYKAVEILKHRLEESIKGKDTIDIEEGRVAQQGETLAKTDIAEIISKFIISLKSRYKGYKTVMKRFGVANVVRAQRLYFLDMYNQYGEFKRGYFFARPDAIPDYYDYEVEDEVPGIKRKIKNGSLIRSKDSPITFEERIKFKRLLEKSEIRELDDKERIFIEKIQKLKEDYKENMKNYEEGSNEWLLELDLFGYCISDWNKVCLEGASKQQVPYIRRYHKEDVWELHKPIDRDSPPLFNALLALAQSDYKYYVEDMFTGKYHPYSKRLADYEFVTKEFYTNYDAATFKGVKGEDEVAFDREAFKNLHNFVYWGRRKYYDTTDTSMLRTHMNPYPAISVIGLWGFIKMVAKRIKEDEISKKFLQEFQMEFAGLEEVKEGEQKR